MTRFMRLTVLGLVTAGSMVGCQSNPYRPTLFQRFRDRSAGPEMSAPQDGPILGAEGSGQYPMAPNMVPPPGSFDPQQQPGPYPPQGMTSPPVQGFPQTMPPAGGQQLPQGPPPKSTPINGK